MDREPLTYEELIRKKKCIDLTKYYNLTKEDLDTIYNFLEDNKDGTVKCGIDNISLLKNNAPSSEALLIRTSRVSSNIDGIVLSNKLFKIIPHYTPSSGGRYSGGSSSNNNNNNR